MNRKMRRALESTKGKASLRDRKMEWAMLLREARQRQEERQDIAKQYLFRMLGDLELKEAAQFWWYRNDSSYQWNKKI